MEFDKDKIEKLFNLAGIELPENYDENSINKALIEIESKLSVSNKVKSDFQTGNSLNILIVDDLELSLHQLNLLLTKSGHNVTISRSAQEARAEMKKQEFDYIILDLFLPDSSDGFALMDYINQDFKNSKFIVISGSEDKALIKKSIEKGASTFVEKAPNWHKILLETITGNESNQEKTRGSNSYTISYKDNKVVCIKIDYISSDLDISHIKGEVSSLINLGFKKIIFDFKDIKDYPLEFSYLFVDVYKACANTNVNFIISSIQDCVYDALKYIFLHETIKTYPSAHDAIVS